MLSKSSPYPWGFIENKTFDEIKAGDMANSTHLLTSKDVDLLAFMSGNPNPTWVASLITHLIDTQLPGPGTIHCGHTLNFYKQVALGDQVTVTITVVDKESDSHRITFDCRCLNQQGEVISHGTADVVAMTVKTKYPRAKLPCIHIESPGTQLQRLVAMTEKYDPIRMAVVHPVDVNSLTGAIDAARANLIIPVLVGPGRKIRTLAEQEGIDLSNYELVETEHSHEAAVEAVAMARAGKVNAIMKGSLHTDELLRAAVQRTTGIATARRMSHVFMVDVPTYPRPLFITDAVIAIDPSLEEKCDIVQNAIELAHALGVSLPKVALLSAVETVNPKLRSTLEAAAICKMAHRKQIVGGIIDGPLAFDNAVSEEAARIKGIESEVAGKADILVAPDLEAGNMVFKQLEYMAQAQSSGIVLGARVPIALTSRADPPLNRMASCALALLLAHNKKRLIP